MRSLRLDGPACYTGRRAGPGAQTPKSAMTQQTPPEPGPPRAARGEILYTSAAPGRDGAERGREFFCIVQQADGVDVLQAHCEIDDAPSVLRDTTLAMRRDSGAPVDCSYRVSVGGRLAGSGWMRFGDDFAECESWTRRDGRVSQRLDLPGPARWLQAHPIAGDALLTRLYDLSQGPGTQSFDRVFLTSPDHRGASGPMLYPATLSLRYVGDADVETPAGRFRARHFQVSAQGLPEEHPPYEVWCSADDDCLLLEARAHGYMQTRYALAELRR